MHKYLEAYSNLSLDMADCHLQYQHFKNSTIIFWYNSQLPNSKYFLLFLFPFLSTYLTHKYKDSKGKQLLRKKNVSYVKRIACSTKAKSVLILFCQYQNLGKNVGDIIYKRCDLRIQEREGELREEWRKKPTSGCIIKTATGGNNFWTANDL
jgi:hypothetical protein